LALEGEDHLVNGGRGDVEEALHVAFGRGLGVDLSEGPDEGEVLALFSVKADQDGMEFCSTN
jgi:hypothetical protein